MLFRSVIDAGSELGDIVGGRIALDAGDLAEIVHRVACVAGASADAEKEDAAALHPSLDQNIDHALDAVRVERPCDELYFR